MPAPRPRAPTHTGRGCHSPPGEIRSVTRDAATAETGQRGFLLTGTEHYLDPYQLALGDIAADLVALRRLTLGNPAQQRRLDVIAPLVDAKLAELRQTIDLRRAGDTAGAIAVVQSDRGKAVMDRLRDTVDAMLVHEQALLAQRTDDWQAAVQWSTPRACGSRRPACTTSSAWRGSARRTTSPAAPAR